MDRVLRGITFKVHELESSKPKSKDENITKSIEKDIPELKKSETKPNFSPISDMAREIKKINSAEKVGYPKL